MYQKQYRTDESKIWHGQLNSYSSRQFLSMPVLLAAVLQCSCSLDSEN